MQTLFFFHFSLRQTWWQTVAPICVNHFSLQTLIGQFEDVSNLMTNCRTYLCRSLFNANINWSGWGCVKPGDKLLHGSVSIAFQCKHYSVRLRLCQTAKRFILITFNVWGCVKPNDKLSNRFVSTTFQCTHIWSLVSPFADMSNPVTKQRTDLC